MLCPLVVTTSRAADTQAPLHACIFSSQHRAVHSKVEHTLAHNTRTSRTSTHNYVFDVQLFFCVRRLSLCVAHLLAVCLQYLSVLARWRLSMVRVVCENATSEEAKRQSPAQVNYQALG